jgi:hypothetical protein
MAISDDDLDACFSTDDFAITAIFSVSAGPDIEVNGYFTDAHEVVDINTGQIVAAAPTFTCRTSETESVRRHDTVTIDGTTYTIERKLPTGIGATDFYLKT